MAASWVPFGAMKRPLYFLVSLSFLAHGLNRCRYEPRTFFRVMVWLPSEFSRATRFSQFLMVAIFRFTPLSVYGLFAKSVEVVEVTPLELRPPVTWRCDGGLTFRPGPQ